MQKTSSWCDWLYLSLFCAYFKIRRLDPGTHNMLWGMMCLGIQCLKLGLRSAPAFHNRTLKWPISADVPQSTVVVACTLERCTIMSSNAPLHFSHFLNFWAVMALQYTLSTHEINHWTNTVLTEAVKSSLLNEWGHVKSMSSFLVSSLSTKMSDLLFLFIYITKKQTNK